LADFYIAHGDNWIYHPGEHYGLSKGIRDYEYNSIKEIGGKNQRDGRVVIEGRDKPRLDFRDNNWYATMNDRLLNYCIANSNLQFYFDPEFPEIYVKQCYLMIRWLEQNFNVTNELVHQIQSGARNYEQWNLALGRDPVFLDEARNGTGKFMQNADHTIMEKYFKLHNPTAYKIWSDGVTEIKQNFGEDWNETSYQFSTMTSQSHLIRPFFPKNTQ
jgi:hypothetical protein